MTTNLKACTEILERAVENLIDLEAGCFERVLLAAKEVFTLSQEHLTEDMMDCYLEFVGRFDRNKGDESHDFIWQSLTDMDDEQRVGIAKYILRLYGLACQGSALIKERQRIAEKVGQFQEDLFND